MVAAGTLTVIPYERRYRTQTLDLLEYSYQRHTHLDWYEPDQWLDSVSGIVRLAWRGAHLVGMMAAAPPIEGATWLRMAAVADGAPEAEVLERLWKALAGDLRQAGTTACWALVLEPWFEYYMPVLHMDAAERLVTLRRESEPGPAADVPGVDVSLATMDDLPAMVGVDHAAFAPQYRLSAQDMRRAFRFSALASVARIGGRAVGYQLSTRHGEQGHLARLAVDPEVQGGHIGTTLVRDLTAAFARRGVATITVNTQASNARSLRLYAACGFTRSSYEIPIYRTVL